MQLDNPYKLTYYLIETREKGSRKMKTIVDWLLEMETIAADFYHAAAESFRSDEKLSFFLTTLAKDEAWHKDLMGKALACLEEAKFQPPVILDEETATKLIRPFIEAKEMISGRAITRDKLYDTIIEAEFSEWNPIFLYTVNALRENITDCFDIAPKVQMHEKYIRRFIETTPDFLMHLEKFKGLPAVWKDKILIVDDEPVILTVIKALFEEEWSVETATNGREALDKLRYSYFDVIVSDINMQPMHGLTFYLEAKKVWPEIGERFLFYSSLIGKYLDFFKENNLSYMMKPSTIKELKKTVLSVAHKEVATRLSELSEYK